MDPIELVPEEPVGARRSAVFVSFRLGALIDILAVRPCVYKLKQRAVTCTGGRNRFQRFLSSPGRSLQSGSS